MLVVFVNGAQTLDDAGYAIGVTVTATRQPHATTGVDPFDLPVCTDAELWPSCHGSYSREAGRREP
ncbi:hypothetical protein [Mycobacterium shottsii]|uniref:hypothetical protein n=1 Tax=Mycobacterium shottsii TaxID=133549 RepID=UPI00217CDDD7|nr:hypothetical protein [Mycobacterium shottsii]